MPDVPALSVVGSSLEVILGSLTNYFCYEVTNTERHSYKCSMMLAWCGEEGPARCDCKRRRIGRCHPRLNMVRTALLQVREELCLGSQAGA